MKMKKLLLEAVVVILCLAGCSTLAADQKKEQLPELKIGVSVYYQDDVFIESIISRLKESVKMKEKEEGYNITLNIVDGQNSQTLQNEQVDKFISQGYDVICMNLVDRTAAATIIDKVKNADIPVIFFNREPVSADMKRWDRVYYVGSRPEEAGTMQGEIVLEQYLKDPGSVDRNHDGRIQYVILEGEQGHQDSLIRTEYCLKPLLDNNIVLEKLANATANWQKSQGEEKMSGWLEEFKDKIEVVFSNNDEMALGAISAIKKAGYEGKIQVVGVDGTEVAIKAVESKEMLGTVINDAKKQADSIFKLAFYSASDQGVDMVEELQPDNCVRIGHKLFAQWSTMDETEAETGR
ncbi:galactose ABC transporter substrate-binding protein [uncultured Robinsoniella sp.]|uniref:galactose ABC transporter substrate-binding protein n=1 Tax=uncultured Robinsoniella sp. TaxID=904190 RepID=UPI00374F49F4